MDTQIFHILRFLTMVFFEVLPLSPTPKLK